MQPHRVKRRNRLLLLFPPSWSLTVGNPHVALPLLAAALRRRGVETNAIDLNWEFGQSLGASISAGQLDGLQWDMGSMNDVYFGVEDSLMSFARSYGGEWDMQRGLHFTAFPENTPDLVRKAVVEYLPFTDYYRESVLPRIHNFAPEIIGFSLAATYQLIPALHLAWLLRQSGFTGTIVCGGNTVSRLQEEIPSCEWLFDLIDGFIVFQGEQPLLQLVDCIEENRKFDEVPNFIWRHEGMIVRNPVAVGAHPNNLPAPDFENLPVGRYWGENCLPLLATRGCYFSQCPFCAIPYGYGGRSFSGVREADLVRDDMIALAGRWGLPRFKFMDEAVPPVFLDQLSARLLESGCDFQWEGFLRLESCWTNRRFVEKLGRGGFRKGYFGLELVDSHNRDSLTKHDRADSVKDVLQLASDSGIKVHLFCMFGFPGTGRMEAERTVEFVLQNRTLIDTVDLNPFTYARHTKVNGISRVLKPNEGWALEFEYEASDQQTGVLSSAEVDVLTREMEEVVWRECPRLLHPVYRLITPWSNSQTVAEPSHAVAACH